MPSSLCHLGESKGNKTIQEAFDDTAEERGLQQKWPIHAILQKENFPMNHENTAECSRLELLYLKDYILKSGPSGPSKWLARNFFFFLKY